MNLSTPWKLTDNAVCLAEKWILRVTKFFCLADLFWFRGEAEKIECKNSIFKNGLKQPYQETHLNKHYTILRDNAAADKMICRKR